MAWPAWASGAMAAGASLGSAGLTYEANKKLNKQAWDRNKEMYATERADNRHDWEVQNAYNEEQWRKQNAYNEMQWHKMNEYNSPMATMERFKEAGLNPNLIYGQGSNTPAIATANFGKSNINPASHKGYSPIPARFDIDSGISAYVQHRESSARVNNLEAQNDVLKQEAAKKAVETSGIALQNAKTKFDYDLANELRSTSVDAAKAALAKIQTETDISLQRNEREAAQNSVGIQEAYQRISNMRGQQVNQALDAQLKQLDIELKRMGVQPSDNAFLRILTRLLNEYGGKFKKGAVELGTQLIMP